LRMVECFEFLSGLSCHSVVIRLWWVEYFEFFEWIELSFNGHSMVEN
jgi:hypothetical protein